MVASAEHRRAGFGTEKDVAFQSWPPQLRVLVRAFSSVCGTPPRSCHPRPAELTTMAKSQNSKKQTLKKPLKTQDEKKAAKRAKKA